MRKNWTICLDLDDTLIPNSFRYNEPTWKCGLIITKALGIDSPYASELMKVQFDLDKSMVEEFGFDAKRFPTSWVRAYETMCERCGKTPDPKVSKKLRHTAERFKFGPFRTFPGVLELLQDLKDARHALHLVTAGDVALQRRKIEQSGVGPFFDGVHIVPVEKGGVLDELSADDPSRSVMVGDSKRSDIVPAIERGMHAVWVPSNTWNYAHAEVSDGSYHTIDSVTKLPDVLATLDRARRRGDRPSSRAAGA